MLTGYRQTSGKGHSNGSGEDNREAGSHTHLSPLSQQTGGDTNFNLFSNSCDQIPGKKQLKREGLILALFKKR